MLQAQGGPEAVSSLGGLTWLERVGCFVGGGVEMLFVGPNDVYNLMLF